VTAIFVTGTGTDVGKTFLSVALIRYWCAAGHAVAAFKPVLSGFDPATAATSDPGLLLAALGRPSTDIDTDIETISPWRFAAPLSPDMAAAREGRALDFEAIVEFSRKAAASAERVLIEGVGGVMVPLDERHTVLDWMSALRLPVLLVAGSYLGTISHTLTALRVLAHRNLTVVALAVSESVTPGAPLGETVATIAPFADLIEVVSVPRLTGDAHRHPAIERIAALIEE
jgi:dethiobiotin synthetase